MASQARRRNAALLAPRSLISSSGEHFGKQRGWAGNLLQIADDLDRARSARRKTRRPSFVVKDALLALVGPDAGLSFTEWQRTTRAARAMLIPLWSATRLKKSPLSWSSSGSFREDRKIRNQPSRAYGKK
jgi:hypothetical protein